LYLQIQSTNSGRRCNAMELAAADLVSLDGLTITAVPQPSVYADRR
jgi:hypothetical protein